MSKSPMKSGAMESAHGPRRSWHGATVFEELASKASWISRSWKTQGGLPSGWPLRVYGLANRIQFPIPQSTEAKRNGSRSVPRPLSAGTNFVQWFTLNGCVGSYQNFSDTEIVMSGCENPTNNSLFYSVLLAGDDGLVGWTRRAPGPRQLTLPETPV